MNDKSKSKRTKEDIARDFELPERKSKIASIMKQDGQAYCVCRSSDCSRFMIGCDSCEEWYHGDCINISEKEAKHIKQYYCQKCKENNPSLKTVFRLTPTTQATGSSTSSENRRKEITVKTDRGNSNTALTVRCGNCVGCKSSNCGVCDGCLSSTERKARCRRRTCVSQKVKTSTSKQKRRRRSPSAEVYVNPNLQGDRQCYGPTCCVNARPQSKFCSDYCGMKLATTRIFQVLPQRIQEWNFSRCFSEEENKKQLDNIRAKQAMVHATLAQLDKRYSELDLIVERAKRYTLDSKNHNYSDIEDEMSMYCITCGHEIHSRTAVRHMEKCFNKYESQASFGSIFKTRIDGTSMFCDFYNPLSKTYCKRLRVLCPEHSKDPKINDDDVCGCPLVTNVFKLTGAFCKAPKKNCFKHYVWEKIRRAEIDLERVRQWLKMDELLEQERQVRTAMVSRAGVLGLMLHSTYNHAVMEELCRHNEI